MTDIHLPRRPLASAARGRTVPALLLTLAMSGCSLTPVPSPGRAPVNADIVDYPVVREQEPSSPSSVSEGAESPLSSRSSTLNSDAVLALAERAEQQSRAGQHRQAESTLERALRLEPRNAGLWYRLARVKYRADAVGQAEQLAEKALSLSGGDVNLTAALWYLIADCRRLAGDPGGADAAEARASGLGMVR